MWFVCGLGNPGKEYQYTRHNFGFIVLDTFAKKNNLHFVFSPELKAEILHYKDQIFLFKPLTYMNLSGESVKRVFIKFSGKISIENFLVIYDDLDLPLGKFKILPKGGSGGHKGVQSIINTLNSKNFPRIKLGIGKPKPPISPKEYVLSSFTPEEWKIVEKVCDIVTTAIEELPILGITKLMTKYNSIQQVL